MSTIIAAGGLVVLGIALFPILSGFGTAGVVAGYKLIFYLNL
jgi:hypothetical protein